MKLEIQATKLDISPEEIARHLPPESREKLKGKKLHPFIIGESGTSQPRDIKSGSSPKLTWPRRAIQALASAVRQGTKFFKDHGKGTNSHDGRDKIGEVVTVFNRETPEGRYQAVAVGVLDSDMPELDICSIEAEVETNYSNEVVDVPEVSAIALGSSNVDSPAFPGAVRLASLQFFDGDNKDKDKKRGDKTMTFSEIRAGVEELALAPHRLFTVDQIKEDTRLMTALTAEFEEKISSSGEELKKLKEENAKLKEQADKAAEAVKKVAVSEGKKRLEESLPEGVTDAQKKYLLSEFNPGGEDDLTDDALKQYVDNGIKKFAEIAKLFGDGSGSTGGSGTQGGSGGGQKSDGEKEPDDALLEKIMG